MDLSRPDPVALQLWTIREAFAEDPDVALRRVKEAGFEAIELAPLPSGPRPEALRAMLDRHGLDVVSIHGELPTTSNVDEWDELAHACRCSNVIWHGWPRDDRFRSLAGVDELVDACNAAAVLAADHGLRLGLHNHWWEFEPLEGESPIRLLNEGLHPGIFWQLDVYWAKVGGVDPAWAVEELRDRLASIHWKDGPAVHGEPMTALGEGKLDISGIVRSLGRPSDWVVELDECAGDRLEAARLSRVYLEELRGRADRREMGR